MVPSRLLIVDIGVSPLVGFQVEADSGVVGRLSVPSTVRVELVSGAENGVSTTAKGEGLESDDGFQVFPGLGLNIEAVDVIKGDAGVVQTTMSTVDVDLALEVARGRVSTRRRSANRRSFVFTEGLVVLDTAPGVLFGVEHPGVIKTAGGRGMSSEDEHLITTNGEGDVLGTRLGLLSASSILFLPNPVGAGHSEGVDVGDGSDFASLSSGSDSTVHEVL